MCVRVFVQCCWVFSHAAALLWFPSAKSGLQRFFPNERFTVHQLGRVGSRCTGSSNTDKYLSF